MRRNRSPDGKFPAETDMLGAAVYRIFFYDGRSRLVGHQEFAAASTRDARVMGAAIFEVCNDQCDSYEIWRRGIKRVTGLRPARFPRPFVLSEELSALTLETEEAIAASSWAIARSRRLLSTLHDLQPHRPDSLNGWSIPEIAD